MKRDSLGSRMKESYESRSQTYLPRRAYTLIRVDGKSFHRYLRDAEKPYDVSLAVIMDAAAGRVMREMQGAEFAYTQSDECSILLTDFARPETNAWFNGNVQKIVSVTASMFTKEFSECLIKLAKKGTFLQVDDLPVFDTRVFSIADPVEVENYFIWRQRDWVRNSVMMAGRALCDKQELAGKSVEQVKAMLVQSGNDWNELPDEFKFGRVIDIHNDKPEEIFQPAVNWLENREDLIKRVPIMWEMDDLVAQTAK